MGHRSRTGGVDFKIISYHLTVTEAQKWDYEVHMPGHCSQGDPHRNPTFLTAFYAVSAASRSSPHVMTQGSARVVASSGIIGGEVRFSAAAQIKNNEIRDLA